MKNFRSVTAVLVLSFFIALMFSSCKKDDPVEPPEPPTPEYVIITLKAYAEDLYTARLYIPVLDIDGSIMYEDGENKKIVGFPYDEFHNTTQLIKVRIVISINGDGKSPYSEHFLEQQVLIDEDKTIVFTL